MLKPSLFNKGRLLERSSIRYVPPRVSALPVFSVELQAKQHLIWPSPLSHIILLFVLKQWGIGFFATLYKPTYNGTIHTCILKVKKKKDFYFLNENHTKENSSMRKYGNRDKLANLFIKRVENRDRMLTSTSVSGTKRNNDLMIIINGMNSYRIQRVIRRKRVNVQ